MATGEERFGQGAWAYFAYGVVYWVGGLILQLSGLTPRPMGPGRVVSFFVLGALLVVVVPWLLVREHEWFDRLLLSRRDFARILTVLVAYRAFEVGRIALRGGPPSTAPAVTHAGAWAFFLITLATMAMLARAAWTRRE